MYQLNTCKSRTQGGQSSVMAHSCIGTIGTPCCPSMHQLPCDCYSPRTGYHAIEFLAVGCKNCNSITSKVVSLAQVIGASQDLHLLYAISNLVLTAQICKAQLAVQLNCNACATQQVVADIRSSMWPLKFSTRKPAQPILDLAIVTFIELFWA